MAQFCRILSVTIFMGLLPSFLWATDFAHSVYGENFLNKSTTSMACSVSTDGWGYNYDSLMVDIQRWRQSPGVTLDSIGTSVQGRIIWMLTISGDIALAKKGERGAPDPKPRIVMHARTHPREVQSTWVVNEAIEYLLQSDPSVLQLKQDFLFNFIPMLNPDGVELGCERTNANGVDMESNWDKIPLEPEVQALKNTFLQFMATESPIHVALNLHSSVNLCTRFFFYHLPGGTSEAFAELEKEYIQGVQSFFPGGFEDWDYPSGQSWANSAPLVYPESFFWYGYGETVMALTYEDSNCPNAEKFDSTARALILGSASYIANHPDLVNIGKKEDRRFSIANRGAYWEVSGLSAEDLSASEWSLWNVEGRLLERGELYSNQIFINTESISNVVVLKIKTPQQSFQKLFSAQF